MSDSRFDGFTEQERAMLTLGLTAFLLDMTFGAISGTPAPPQTMARDFPVLVQLVGEIGGSFGLPGVDPTLIEGALTRIRRAAAAGSN